MPDARDTGPKLRKYSAKIFFKKSLPLLGKVSKTAVATSKSRYHFGEVRSAFMLPPVCLFPNIHWLQCIVEPVGEVIACLSDSSCNYREVASKSLVD
jgi:hypothetical protein